MTEAISIAAPPCPPPEAVAAHGCVYRCCRHDPPTAADLRSHEEKGLLPNADPCLRRALSVLGCERDTCHQISLFPRWKKKYIARAILNAHHGRLCLTLGQQPTHTSWWPAEGLDPAQRAQLFRTCGEVV